MIKTTPALKTSSRFGLVFCLAFGLSAAKAQTVMPDESFKKTPAGSNLYVSDVDKMLTIHKIGILPVTDNVGGLYSRYVEAKLAELIKGSHRFDLAEVKDVDARLSTDDYEAKPEMILALAKKANADAFIAAKINKNKKGIDITVDLFLSSDGNLISQETLSSDPKFGTNEAEIKTTELYEKVIAKLPYRGLVLSRQGNRVTLDVGTKDGIRDGAVISVEQIIAIKRHPKFKFIVSTEKEILGKVRIVKADETLSFGVVLQEKERGIIVPDTKVTGLDYVNYPDPAATDPGANAAGPDGPAKDAVSFGKHPREWTPPKQPSLGKIGFMLGLGTLQNNVTLTPAESFSTTASVYPQLFLNGEIWLTPNWYVGAELGQGVLSMSNPQSGSSPSNLGSNNAHYDFHGGYKFLLQDDFFGPTLNLHAGLADYSLTVPSSTPLTFSSSSYSGLYLGFGGSMPVAQDRSYYLDLNLDLWVSPALSETPFTSAASSSNSATSFSLGGTHKLTNQFWIEVHLRFEFYRAQFSGSGGTRPDGETGTDANQSLTTLIGGIDYMF